MGASLTRWLSLRAYGAVTSTLFGASTPPRTMRKRFERFGSTPRARMQHRRPDVAFTDHAVGALKIEAVRATPAPSRVVLYLHGGAYVMGSPASYRSRTVRVAYRCNAVVLVPDYRLAPEHPFPAALDDALAAWRHLRTLHGSVPAFVAGDSAGGGLALSLLLRLRELREQAPDGAILLSPWLDLSDPGDDGATDLWFRREHLERWARYYVGNSDPRNPLISPALADLSGLPPLMVLAGEHELLAAGARRLVERARAVGTDATLHVGAGMQHDWPLTLPWLEESRQAWQAMTRFVDTHARPAAPQGAHP